MASAFGVVVCRPGFDFKFGQTNNFDIGARACYGMDEKFCYGRCTEWNGMEDLKNGMEDRLPY